MLLHDKIIELYGITIATLLEWKIKQDSLILLVKHLQLQNDVQNNNKQTSKWTNSPAVTGSHP